MRNRSWAQHGPPMCGVVLTDCQHLMRSCLQRPAFLGHARGAAVGMGAICSQRKRCPTTAEGMGQVRDLGHIWTSQTHGARSATTEGSPSGGGRKGTGVGEARAVKVAAEQRREWRRRGHA